MASFKETQAPSRSLTHRPSMSSSSVSGSSLLNRQSHSRNNSHSLSAGSLNATHRVTRRKSMTITGANVAAVAVAAGLKEVGDRVMPLPVAISARRNTTSRNGVSRSALSGSLPSPPASLPTQKYAPADGTVHMQESAIDDELNDMSGDDGDSSLHNNRIRRASDGQPLVKEGRKSNRPELRCEKCGKGYKHSSCLTKHLWEHTPEWSYTSKLLISKHQQVQLLEAASVLVAMNDRLDSVTTPPDSTRDSHSEQDSASPEASAGYLDEHEASSADTTPPPPAEGIAFGSSYTNSFAKRHHNGVSRSYQSAPFSSSIGSGISNGLSGHFRQLSQDVRPTSSGKNATGQEDRDLAAAVELLSCSFGSTTGSRTVHLPGDVPPVPPLPARYLEDALTGVSFINSFPGGAPESFTRGVPPRDIKEDVKMDESGDSVMDDDEDDTRSRARSDEDDDGVFGRMEE
ncbi:hypothetical protein V8F06_000792 [Rhypophila decipiens]